MPHCWKSHVVAQLLKKLECYTKISGSPASTKFGVNYPFYNVYLACCHMYFYLHPLQLFIEVLAGHGRDPGDILNTPNRKNWSFGSKDIL